MITKRLMIVNGMTGHEMPIRVAEGTKPADILKELGLKDHRLARVRDRQVLSNHCDVTRTLQDGDRLFAFPPMDVGVCRLARAIRRLLFRSPPGNVEQRPPAEARRPVHTPLRSSRGNVERRPTAEVRRPVHTPQGRRPPPRGGVLVLRRFGGRPPRPYWQLRGWRRVASNTYLGYFKTRLGRCHGVIKWSSRVNCSFYVHDVPRQILSGPHGPCFDQVKPGKYRIHFSRLPHDLNSAIFYIETLLQEAFKHGRTS